MTSTDTERAMAARIAAHTSWADTPDRAARTLPARRALLDKFEREADPHGTLPAERAKRAENLRKAHYARMALKSAQARRRPVDHIAKRTGAVDLLAMTAHHEAGHAVAAVERGGWLQSITIEPGGDYLGRASYLLKPWGDVLPRPAWADSRHTPSRVSWTRAGYRARYRSWLGTPTAWNCRRPGIAAGQWDWQGGLSLYRAPSMTARRGKFWLAEL